MDHDGVEHEVPATFTLMEASRDLFLWFLVDFCDFPELSSNFQNFYLAHEIAIGMLKFEFSDPQSVGCRSSNLFLKMF